MLAAPTGGQHHVGVVALTRLDFAQPRHEHRLRVVQHNNRVGIGGRNSGDEIVLVIVQRQGDLGWRLGKGEDDGVFDLLRIRLAV